jgi:hypothetical protein
MTGWIFEKNVCFGLLIIGLKRSTTMDSDIGHPRLLWPLHAFRFPSTDRSIGSQLPQQPADGDLKSRSASFSSRFLDATLDGMVVV